MSKHIFIDYRKKHGLTQSQLALKIGVSRQMVSFIELGERDITPENANEWAKKLGVERALLNPIFRETRAA